MDAQSLTHAVNTTRGFSSIGFQPLLPTAVAARSTRERSFMIDTTKEGTRCCAKQLVRSHAGIVAPPSRGTIVYEIEDMERQLICVRWEAGFSTYVFADEVETVPRCRCTANP